MNKELQNLPSEQIPNDGGWHWHELIEAANDRLGKIGKHGKRAKVKVVPKPGKPISAQFSLPGKGQQNPGLNLPLNRNNLIKAEEICALITGQLVAGTFSQEWLDSLLGKNKKPAKEKKGLTCEEMLKQYKTHYFKQRKDNKTSDNTWRNDYRHTEETLFKYRNKPISSNIIKEIINCTDNNTPNRARHLNGLANFFKFFDNNEFKPIIKRYKTENNPKPGKKHIPDDTEVLLIYQTGFEINPQCPKRWHYRYPQWQFLYSLLAIYGLRVHEAWNIKNWDTSVTIKDGDWIAIADDTEDINNEDEQGKYLWEQYRGKSRIIPAILDPKNEDYLLCIGHETKTGLRVAFPISTNGYCRSCEWIKKFNLLQPLNLPDMPNPLKRRSGKGGNLPCSHDTGQWFRTHEYGFTPHALRHAYNIRGHKLGINQKVLANSLGHSLQMNSSSYLKHEGDFSKIQGIQQSIDRDMDKRSELERLREENTYLKAENEKLRTELTMYKSSLRTSFCSQ